MKGIAKPAEETHQLRSVIQTIANPDALEISNYARRIHALNLAMARRVILKYQETLAENSEIFSAYRDYGIIRIDDLKFSNAALDLSDGLVSVTLQQLIRSNPIYANAQNKNIAVKDFQQHPDTKVQWSVDKNRKNSVVVLHFVGAIVWAPVGEGISFASGKSSFGRFIQATPIAVDDELHPHRLSYYPTNDNPWKRRAVTRNELKLALGADGPRLVARVSQGVPRIPEIRAKQGYSVTGSSQDRSKRTFLEELATTKREKGVRYNVGLYAGDAQRIINQTRLSPQAFFDAVKKGNYEHVKTLATPGARRERAMETRYFVDDDLIVALSLRDKWDQIVTAQTQWQAYLGQQGIAQYQPRGQTLDLFSSPALHCG